MFFQSIHQMLAAGTELSINIRRMDDHLSVVVMPRRTNLKDESGQLIVPLVLNGTPAELDGQFLQAVTTPLQKAQGILINLKNFEKQAGQAVAQSKAAKAVEDKESKEAREKREKKEKELCRQLSESQTENLARFIISEAGCTDVSRGVSSRKKRRLPPAGATMIF